MSDVPPPPGAWPPPPGGFPTPPPPPTSGFGTPPPPGYTDYNPSGPPTIDVAGFWIRFLAFVIDGLIIGIPFFLLGEIFSDDTTTTTTFSNGTATTTSSDGVNISFGWNPNAPGWLNTLNTLVGLAYFGYFEGGLTGQTLGKRVVGIRVVNANTGQPGIGFARAVGRYFSRILSAIPCLLGYFWMLWDDRKQTWHDKLVTTSVIKG